MPKIDDVTVVKVTGELASRVAAELVHSSVWFEAEPWPNGVWEFTVKREAKAILARSIDGAREAETR